MTIPMLGGDRPTPADEVHAFIEGELAGWLGGDDMHTLAHALVVRAQCWTELARTASGPVKTAYHLAAAADEEAAARTRFEHGIPTLLPRSEAARIALRTCEVCGRPWQADPEGACQACPVLLYGPTPRTQAEADELRPAVRPVTAGQLYPPVEMED